MTFTSVGLVVVTALVAAYLISAAFAARLIIRPGRSRAWTTPKAALGLDYEDVEFPAHDGTRLRGWFIPAVQRGDGTAPTVVSLHGWPWNRMGTQANSPLNDLPGSQPVDLLPLFGLLREAGYNVLAFDLRNFGESEGRGVVTGGWLESRDVLGAIDYLEGRADVDPERIGVIGFSNGGAALVFALPRTERIRAGIAVQPTTAGVFAAGYTRALFGPAGPSVRWGAEMMYRLAGGPALDSIDLTDPARAARDTPVLYVQGTGDRWGSLDDVERMADATPRSELIVAETGHRFEGYRHVLEHPDIVLAFFDEHLRDRPQSTGTSRDGDSE